MKKKSETLVYIAGPYRAPTLHEIQCNIDEAREVAVWVAQQGFFPVCPHLLEGLCMHDINQKDNGQFWVEATLELMRRCDAVMIAGDWHHSAGTRGEMIEAVRLGIPVYQETGLDGGLLRLRELDENGGLVVTRWEEVKEIGDV